MTSNLPLIFENYKYGNNFYIDGGIVDNFSIDVAQTIGNRVLGIHILFENFKFSTSDNVLDYIYKLIYIPIKQQQKFKLDNICKKKCKLITLIDKTNRSMFNFNLSSVEKLDMFSTGYRQCKSVFWKIFFFIFIIKKMLCAPKLRRELSLPYYFINDRTKINVPLWYRLKFDEVVRELKKKNNPDYQFFDYLLD